MNRVALVPHSPFAWLRATRVMVAVALVAAGAATGCRASSRSEGTVEIAAGFPILVRAGDRLELVVPERGATLLGMDDIDTPVIGDPVRWVTTREAAGVKYADVLELAPLVQTEVALQATPDQVQPLFSGPPSPEGRAALAVDARPADEYARGHLAGAISVPPDRLDHLADLLPRDRKAPILFYSRGPRCPLAVGALRRAVAAGWENARVYLGGLQHWTAAGGLLEVLPADLAAFAGETAILDVRPSEEAAAGTLPGAASRPLAELAWTEFKRGVWLPPIVLVGRDAADPAAYEAALKLRQWRFLDQRPVPQRFLVLAGGFRRWKDEGRAVARGAALPRAVPYRAAEGEVAPEEFLRLWSAAATAGGAAGPVFLDVRGGGPRELPGFVKQIGLEELPARLGELPKDRELVVFCSVGKRSTIARELLVRNGFRARSLRARFPQPAD